MTTNEYVLASADWNGDATPFVTVRPVALSVADPATVSESGVLYLPFPYVVPGGRFNEMYGWDSYFTLLGLVRDGELELARQVQLRLFPQTTPSLSTLECAAVCIQARQVGGDYYDFLELGRNQLGLVIGDVSGKGVAAALLMANLQAHLRNQSATYSSRPYVPFVMQQPQRFLISVNRLFYENTADSAFATLFFGEYDDRLRRLRYVNCGHLPALVLRHDNHLERLEPTGTVLGLFKGWDCSAGERALSPGDTVAFYTDGVTESFNDAGEEFGESRLVDALYEHRDLPPQNLLASLVKRVRSFSPHEQRDDITLLVARCK